MTIHELTMNRLNGTPESLSVYAGKVVLVVNTASACGYTPQYQGLEELWQQNRERDVVVLGFPSNDFGEQEPGSSDQIATFCETKYNVSFPLFEKVVTKGPNASPLYKFLSAWAGEPQWNFHKYLVDRKGKVVKAFPSSTKPTNTELLRSIEEALAQ